MTLDVLSAPAMVGHVDIMMKRMIHQSTAFASSTPSRMLTLPMGLFKTLFLKKVGVVQERLLACLLLLMT